LATKDSKHRRGGRRVVTFAWPGGEPGRHRLRQPSTGLIAVSAVVLAASTASSTVAAAPAATTPPAPASEGTANGGTVPLVSFPQVETHLTSGRIVGVAVPSTATGIVPATVLAAYQRAVERANLTQPNCHIPLELLAAIGKVESGHARGGQVDETGRTLTPILGPLLNGGPFAAITDTDDGRYDGDTSWDRAVGPMQFIPGTWARWASDGNADGLSDPQNVYDASLAAARYLCAANRDLGTPAGLDEAILSYNHSTSYLSLVRSWMAVYRNGTVSVDDILNPGWTPTTVPASSPEPTTPPQTPPTVPPATPPSTPPSAVPVTPATPPTIPTPPTTPPTTPPVDPPVTEPDPAPPADQPPTDQPTEEPPTEPADQCDLLDTVGAIEGGLLGENPDCVHELELSTPDSTAP
jgi:hypothetical protein